MLNPGQPWPQATDTSTLLPQHRAFQEQHHAFPGSEEATAVPWALRDLPVPPHTYSGLQSESGSGGGAGQGALQEGKGMGWGSQGVLPGARVGAEDPWPLLGCPEHASSAGEWRQERGAGAERHRGLHGAQARDHLAGHQPAL